MTAPEDDVWDTTNFGTQAFNAQHFFNPQQDPSPQINHGNIDNLHNTDIHDIWHMANFRALSLQDVMRMISTSNRDYIGLKYAFSENLYLRMRPALRLATRLLDRARYALMHIAYTPIVVEGTRLRFDGKMTVDMDMEHNFDVLLSHIAGRVLFFHYPYDSQRQPTLGLTAINPRARRMSNSDTWYVSAFADGFFHAFNHSHWHQLPFHYQDSVSVAFASILVHELAHLVFKHSRLEMITKFKLDHGFEPPEPFLWKGDTDAELGAAIERYLFGGRLMLPTPQTTAVDSIPPPAFDGSLGVSILLDQPHPECPDSELPNFGNKVWFIHPKTLMLLMHSKTFTNFENTNQDFQGWPYKAPIWFGVTSTPMTTPLQERIDGPEGDIRRAAVIANETIDTHSGRDLQLGFTTDRAGWWRRREVRIMLFNRELRYEPSDVEGEYVWIDHGPNQSARAIATASDSDSNPSL